MNRLSAGHRKTAFALRFNCALLIAIYGLERIGFLTLTFAAHIVDYKVAQKALHSLMTGVLRHRYREYIIVMERMDSGRIHYHLLVVMAEDIRTGFDFDAVKAKDYRSASAYLQAEWEFWRKTADDYGFGRHELLPIKSTAEGIANYVGKYIEKHILFRLPEDKGARLVRYSKGTNRVSTRFTWRSPGADLWRTKLGTFCRMVNLTSDNYAETFRAWYGQNWSHTLGPIIASLRPLSYPSFWTMQKDYPTLNPPAEDTWTDPDFDPNTGPWMNRYSDEARKTLLAAWITALDERERRMHRKKCRLIANRAASPDEGQAVGVAGPQVHCWIPWIERSMHES